MDTKRNRDKSWKGGTTFGNSTKNCVCSNLFEEELFALVPVPVCITKYETSGINDLIMDHSIEKKNIKKVKIIINEL